MKINKETKIIEALTISSKGEENITLHVGDIIKVKLEPDSGFNDSNQYEGELTFIDSDGFGTEQTSEEGYPVIDWEYVVEIEKIEKTE